MNKSELLKRVGSIEQLGGIREFVFSDGRARGVRGIEVNAGDLRFTVIPDRCLDIAHASYKGKPVSWISSTGVTSPTSYEKDGRNWMRGFFGGLMTTCGLRNIGSPAPDRHEGLHGRISFVPAENLSVYSGWEGEDYVMRISGEMRETIALGYYLVLKRTISTKLFSDKIEIEDTIINEGVEKEDIVICYHCNFGYPLVCEDARITNVPDEIASISGPMHGIEEECIPVDVEGKTVTVGIENKEMGAYLTYETENLPEFMIWKMLRERGYVIGLEPRTTCQGGANIEATNGYRVLEPSEEFKTRVSFEFKSL